MGKSIRIALTALVGLLLAGCVTPKDFDTGGTIRAVNAGAADLATPKTVYFATTRCKGPPAAGAPGTKEDLLAKRCWEPALKSEEVLRLGFGMAESESVTCGSATVAVVPSNADDKAATSVATPVSFDCGGDFAALRQVVLSTPCRCALIYVHGYNTTFAYGIKRMAQIALDLSYEGVPILFSFAAGGRFDDYVNDAEAEELAAPALHRLLLDLTRKDGTTAPDIDIIAHSMGARLTLRAIDGGEAPSPRYVVLAAPDIDPVYFLRLAEKAAPRTRRMTVYTAKYDVAMSGSKATHAGWPRVGEGLNPGVAQHLGRTDIIDATERATDPYAHSYFAESKVVVDDIREGLKGTPAARRAPLVCSDVAQVTVCRMPCPEGARCGPTWYARFIHWLLD